MGDCTCMNVCLRIQERLGRSSAAFIFHTSVPAVLDSLAVQVLPGVSLAFRLLGGVVISYCFWKAYNLEMLFAFPICAGLPCCAVSVRGTIIRAGNKIGQGMALFFCTENETYACLLFFKQDTSPTFYTYMTWQRLV